MIIKNNIEIPISKKGLNYVVRGSWALPFVLGTTSVNGNKHMYKIKKMHKNVYIVPISLVKERVQELKDRVISLNSKINLIEQVLKETKEGK